MDPHLTRLPVLLALGLLASCSPVTALDLTLVADPNINAETTLVAKLASLQVAISDGQDRLETPVDMTDLGHLPLIRVEQGAASKLPLDFAIDGIGADDKTGQQVKLAAGGAEGYYFSEGEVVSVNVPFNLRALYLPPRVTSVYPEDGETQQAHLVGNVLLVFSKAMSPDSLVNTGVIRVLRVEGSQETPVPAREIVLGELSSGGPTTASYVFTAALEEGSYGVRVSQGALDTSGRPLDQVPMLAGNQPFASQFKVGAQTSTAMACPGTCESLWCGNGGEACPTGLKCDKAAGSCVPDRCPKTCPVATVCDPALTACVMDCRPYGTHGGCDSGTCSAETGLCTP